MTKAEFPLPTLGPVFDRLRGLPVTDRPIADRGGIICEGTKLHAPLQAVEPMSDHLERPIDGPPGNALFGNDIVAETPRALDITYIALNLGRRIAGRDRKSVV